MCEKNPKLNFLVFKVIAAGLATFYVPQKGEGSLKLDDSPFGSLHVSLKGSLWQQILIMHI